ncbi:MAG: BTAD domain-containing putative transcriptional regulator [Caldilineaceae bacterium]
MASMHMAQLQINLLGGFQIRLNSEEITTITSPKIQALLAYLAVESKRVHSRDALAALLWPDTPERLARQNLRQSLSRLQKALPQPKDDPLYLRITRQEVGFNRDCPYVLDVEAFVAALDAARAHAHEDVTRCDPCCARLADVLARQRGDFLDGVAADSLPFDEWAMLKREWLRREQLTALDVLTQHAIWRENFAAAYGYAWRQIEIDPLNEDAHHDAMRALALDGRTRDALAQFDQLCAILDAELDVRPAAKTSALADSIRAGLRLPADEVTTSQPSPTPVDAPTHLPPQFTPFIGREDELTQIADLLVQPNCRLVTLVGMGGVGKTRLSVEVAQRQADHFADGVFFVALAPVSSPMQLVAAIAHAVGFTLPMLAYTLDEQQDALARFLRAKSLLLVLDNYEHLLPEVDLIARLLPDAPGVMLLVTSRAPLELRAEWVLEIDGLPFPPLRGPARPLNSYAAVQMFTSTVDRIKPGALRQDTTAPDVARICGLVQGAAGAGTGRCPRARPARRRSGRRHRRRSRLPEHIHARCAGATPQPTRRDRPIVAAADRDGAADLRRVVHLPRGLQPRRGAGDHRRRRAADAASCHPIAAAPT